jgi:hypothetical protein
MLCIASLDQMQCLVLLADAGELKRLGFDDEFVVIFVVRS